MLTCGRQTKREGGGSQGWGVGGQQAMERTMYEVRPEKRARLTLLDDGDRSDAIDEVDFFASSIFLDPLHHHLSSCNNVFTTPVGRIC